MSNVEVIEFEGVRFRRYPDSKNRSDRVYFTPGQGDRKKGVKRLHEEVWQAANGPIPNGHQIHHRDGDPLNNELENLECVSAKEHAARHWSEERRQQQRAWAEKIRPLTKDWHSSPAGKRWHSEHSRKIFEAMEEVSNFCDHCGKEYEVLKHRSAISRFCSNNCKSAWRRKAGIDDEVRKCPICQSPFVVNRYSRKKTCSAPCAKEMTKRTKRKARGARAPASADSP